MSELSIDTADQLEHALRQQSSVSGSAVRQLDLRRDSEPASIPDAMSEEAERNLEEATSASTSDEYDTAEEDECEGSHSATTTPVIAQNIRQGCVDPELAPYIPPCQDLNVMDDETAHDNTIVSQSHQTRMHLSRSEGDTKLSYSAPASSSQGGEALENVSPNLSADGNQLGATDKAAEAPLPARRVRRTELLKFHCQPGDHQQAENLMQLEQLMK